MERMNRYAYLSVVYGVTLLLCGCQPQYGQMADALERGDLAGVQKMLASDPKIVDARNELGFAPLHNAAQIGSKEEVEALLSAKAQVNAVTSDKCLPVYGDWGFTPLYEAARYGHKDAAASLMSKGARVDATTAVLGMTPLHAAAANDYAGLSKFLFSKGLNKNIAWIGHEYKDVTELLIAAGANVNARNSGGATPLFLAAMNQNKLIAEALIAKGADVNLQNNAGGAALHAAAKNGQVDLAAVLIAAGADANIKAKDGTTPLHLAAKNGHLEMVQLLIEKGAEVNATDAGKDTPLHWACGESAAYSQMITSPEKGANIWMVSQREKVLEFLIAKGADVNAKDAKSFGPIDFAKSTNQTGLVELLSKHGAVSD